MNITFEPHPGRSCRYGSKDYARLYLLVLNSKDCHVISRLNVTNGLHVLEKKNEKNKWRISGDPEQWEKLQIS